LPRGVADLEPVREQGELGDCRDPVGVVDPVQPCAFGLDVRRERRCKLFGDRNRREAIPVGVPMDDGYE